MCDRAIGGGEGQAAAIVLEGHGTVSMLWGPMVGPLVAIGSA
jgi:hypothetical protein